MILSNATGNLLLQTMLYLVAQQDNNTFDDTNTLYHVNIGEDNNGERCYGVYGCFKISAPWTSESRPVSLFPDSPEKINPRYLMYTRLTSGMPHFLDVTDPEVVSHSKINTDLPIFFISHGYMEAGDRPWIHAMAMELLAKMPCTVIAIDWHGGSSPPYTQAVANIRLVGAMTAHLLAAISEVTGDKKLDHVHMIGHSLGAHLSGYVGYTLQDDFGLKLGRITGLDPAEPHFAKSEPKIRLDKMAAQYVDIVHTDAAGFVKGGFGLIENIGHVDYYPNGGLDQPGCNDGVLQHIAQHQGSLFHGVKKYVSCNHVRSHEIFTESIRSPNRLMSIRCASYEDFKSGKCFDCNTRGQFCIEFGLKGVESYRALERDGRIEKDQQLITYFLTGKTKPYLRAHYRVTAKLSNTTQAIKHGGEIGILWITIQGTKGVTERMPLRETQKHYAPGELYMNVLAGAEVGYPISVTVEWDFKTSFVNPLTWRLLANPRVYVDSVTVESLEYNTRIKACPAGHNTEFDTNQPRKLLPTYCSYNYNYMKKHHFKVELESDPTYRGKV